MNDLLYDELIPGSCHGSLMIRRGHELKLIDVAGDANLGMLMYNPENLLERLNIPDTLKCQHTFKLTRGHCLYSDMGRVFCSIIEDSVGWHDAATGTCNKRIVERKWGRSTYQQERNLYHRNGLDSFLIELAKYELTKRDLAANVNWFSRVNTDDLGNISLQAGNSRAGDSVVLRFEMDTLLIFHACAHPLDNSEEYPRRDVRYEIRKAKPIEPNDICAHSRRENEWGFANNRLYHCAH